jgi:secreted PhoX family phosphatase
VWECDPWGLRRARVLPDMGSFAHEAAAIDPVRKQVYLTEDRPDGRFYRFTPTVWHDLARGLLEVARRASDGSVTWHEINDPHARNLETRYQVPSSTRFGGGEGCYYADGHVYITTKDDNRVWDLDIDAANMSILYNGADYGTPRLTGVDNLIVAKSGDILVAEDGGSMEIIMITREGALAPLLKATGVQHFDNVVIDGLPTESEISSIAFNPAGNRLYFSSQRGFGIGITYEVRGPFRA